MNLSFQTNPISFANVNKNIHGISSSGIYVWGFLEDNGGFLPYYVGQANKMKIYDRLIGHYNGLGYIRYTLFAQSELLNFREYIDGERCKNILKYDDAIKNNAISYFNIDHQKDKISTQERQMNAAIQKSADFYRNHFYFKFSEIIRDQNENDKDFARKLNYAESFVKFYLLEKRFPTISTCHYSYHSYKKRDEDVNVEGLV